MARLLTLLMSYRPEAASGYVRTYTTGTTTLATKLYPTAADADAATNVYSNPQSLDSNGMLECYVPDDATNFRLRIYNSDDDTILDDVDPAVHSAGLTTDEVTVDATNGNAFTAGASETLDDAIDFLHKCLSNQSAAATAADLKVLGTDTGRTGRYIYEQVSDFHNILDYGAPTDNSSNSATAIQAAIDAAATAGGGRVYIPGGYVFNITTGLTISGQDGVCIVGDGAYSIIRASTNMSMFTVDTSSQGAEFCLLQLQGGGGTGTTDAIGIAVDSTVGNTKDEIPVSIHDVVFSGNADGTGHNIGVDCQGSRIRISNCHFMRIYNATIGVGVRLSNGSKIVVNSNYFSMKDAASTAAAYGIRETSATGDHVIVGNNIEGALVAGIKLVGSGNSTVAGNTCVDGAGHGISCDNTGNTAITGNSCHNNGGSGISLVDDIKGLTVTGNSCFDNTVHGIRVEQTVDDDSVPESCVISGNTLRSNTQSGIVLLGTDDCLVQGNIITNDSNGSNNTYPAIDVDDAMTARGGNDNAIVGNMVRDITSYTFTHPIRIRDTTSTRVIGNDFAPKTGGTESYSYDVSGRAPPYWAHNMGNGARLPVIRTSGATVLVDGDSGSLVVITGAHQVTLPTLVADAEHEGMYFTFVNEGATTGTVVPGGSDVIIQSDGQSGSIDFNMISNSTSSGANAPGTVMLVSAWDGSASIKWFCVGAVDS